MKSALNTFAMDEAFSEMESGLIVPSDYVESEPPRPKGMDLFAGAGGMSCGFHQAGWHMVAASEYWDAAAYTYLMNLGSPGTKMHFCTETDHKRWDAYLKKNKINPDDFGRGWVKDHGYPCEHFFFGDIRELKCKDVLEALEMEPGDLDCIAGGPPCQGFSTAGKKNVMDPRNSLVFEFCRMIVGIQPKTMVFENVPGIVNMVTPEGVNVIDAICLYLSEGGYGKYEALRKSLAGMPDARGAIRRPPTEKEKDNASSPKNKEKSVPEQLEISV